MRRMAHRLPVHGGRPTSGQRIGHHQMGCRERSRTLACALKQARRRGLGGRVISSGARRRCKRRLLVPDGYRVCATCMRQKWTVRCTAATVHILVRCEEAVRSDPTRHGDAPTGPVPASPSCRPPPTAHLMMPGSSPSAAHHCKHDSHSIGGVERGRIIDFKKSSWEVCQNLR